MRYYLTIHPEEPGQPTRLVLWVHDGLLRHELQVQDAPNGAFVEHYQNTDDLQWLLDAISAGQID